MRIIKKIIMYLLLFMLCVFPISIFSSCANLSCGLLNPKEEPIRDKIFIETDIQVDLKPNEEKQLAFTSKFSGFFTIESQGGGNFIYYCYKANCAQGNVFREGDYAFIQKQEEYYLDIINIGNSNFSKMRVSLKSIAKNDVEVCAVKAGETIAYKYQSHEKEILEVKTSNSKIVVSKIICLDNEISDVLYTEQTVCFEKNKQYIIEVCNMSINEINTAELSIMDIMNPGSQIVGNIKYNIAYCNMNLKMEESCNEEYISEVVTSFERWIEISPFLPDYNYTFDGDFFNDNVLIVFLQKRGNGGASLEKVEMFVDNNIAKIKLNANNGILTVLTKWGLILEISKNDMLGVSEIILESNFGCNYDFNLDD